jgi:hypothetical protein
MSANPKYRGSQFPYGDSLRRCRGAGEVKIEANPEGKIELESEVLAGPLTTHLLV